MKRLKDKLINILKHILFYTKLIFWIVIIALSLGSAVLFIPEDMEEQEYIDSIGLSWDANYKKEKYKELIKNEENKRKRKV